MQKILDFIKNKGIGYYIAAGITLFSLIVAIIFFATYSNPALDPIFGNDPMGNKADGLLAVTIGIFLLAGTFVEAAVLVVPQYRFIQIIAIAMFGLALYKEVMIIPDFFAGIANNVMYNGGNVVLNMFFFISLLLIVIASIVAAFMGFYKKEEDSKADFKNIKGTANIVKVGCSAAVVVAAVVVSSLVTLDLTNKANAGSKVRVKPAFVFEPINEDVEAAADEYAYEYEAKDVVVRQKETYNFSASEVTGITTGNTRSNHYLVYVFEGAYAEGYQGDYSETYASIYLWDDGLYGGSVGSTSIRGYWYNSSLDAEVDPETGKYQQNCLNLVSNVSKYESIICARAAGFYEWRAHIYLGFSWGTRSMEVSAYRYYPEVALAIDASVGNNYFFTGEEFDRDGWVANRILKDLNYSAVFKASEVQWTDPEGLKNHQKIEESGEYEVKATWKNGFNKTFEATITVTVVD